MTTPAHPRMLATVATLLITALVAAGCGGDEAGGGGDANPAEVVPAGVPLYLEATVRPEGDLREDAVALASKLLDTEDPEADLRKLFDDAAREDGVTYAEEIEPWLGERVGLFFTSFGMGGEDEGEGAIVAAHTDADAAQEALTSIQEGEESVDRTHMEREYQVADDTAYAVLDDYVVVGSEDGMKAVIEELEGDGDGLAGSEGFQQAGEALDGDGLARVYAEPQALLSAAAASSDSDDAGVGAAQLAPLLGGELPEAVGALLTASGDRILVDSATVGGGEGAASGGGGGGAVLPELPGDSWLGAGIPDVGGTLDRTLTQVSSLGALGGVDVDQQLEALRRQTGLDVRQDLLRWMGDGALFARGTALTQLGGGLVVQSTDPEATQEAIPNLGRLLEAVSEAQVRPLERDGVDEGVTAVFPDMPVPIHIAAAGERFVVAAGDAALDAVLEPQGTLGESESFRTATSVLGDDLRPSLFVDVPPVLQLGDGLGAFQDPEAAMAREALDALTSIVAGGARDGEVSRGRLAIGVE